jgi:MFS family permease
MHEQIRPRHLAAFFSGSFISQIGTYVFIFGMMFFPAQAGWTPFQIGFLLSITHFSVVVGILKWGDLGDRISPKTLLVRVEFIAMVCSLIFMFCWQFNTPISRYMFIFFVGIRSMFIAIQSPSKNKYLKLITSEHQKSKKFSMLLTAINQGSGIFSSVLCLIFFNKFTFMTSMLFDAITYLINGLLILSLPELPIAPSPKFSFKDRFKTYLSIDKFLSFKDITASIAITGISMLMVRLSVENKDLAFYLGGTFGLSFWIGGLILHRLSIKHIDHYIWPLYALAYFLLSFAQSDVEKILGMAFVCLMYAMLMQTYVSTWQHEAKVESISSVFSIRNIILTLTLGLGELLLGKFSTVLTLQNELQLRAAFTAVIFIIIIFIRKTHESK